MIDALPLLLGPEGYQISRSVRLRSSASAYFNRTPASASNRRTWTFSTWLKRGSLGSFQGIFTGKLAKDDTSSFYTSSDTLSFLDRPSNVTNISLSTAAVFRDPSAWYHLILVADTTNATSGDRMRLFVNGVRQTLSGTYPSLNYEIAYINNTVAQALGIFQDTSALYLDGYLTEINFIDGQALTPSSFGETNAVTGVWQPKKYTGTYGTNGFYLNFSDNSAATAAAIGKDNSGNGNNWTPNNISVTAGATYDSMLDVPTQWADGGNGRGNYATLNPLNKGANLSLSAANLEVTYATTASASGIATMACDNGKWYWEVTLGTVLSGAVSSYVVLYNQATWRPISHAGSGYIAYRPSDAAYVTDSGGSGSFSATAAAGDVIGVAVDTSAGTFQIFKNGTSIGTITGLSINTNTWSPGYSFDATISTSWKFNFGQRPFAYTPPSGFKALNTLNLPTPTILKGNQYFNTVLYTGNGGTLSVTGVGFQPDFVWLKSRGAARSHRLWDAVRGATNGLSSDLTNAEYVESGLTAFNSDGFTLGSQSGSNTNAESFVAWNWKEGATQGFDIVTFTAPATNQSFTVNHSLGVTPSMIIVKRRDSATGGDWWTWHIGLGNNTTDYVALNQTAAEVTAANMWGTLGRDSTAFGVNVPTSCVANGTYVAYLFAEVAGFSRFGSYTGNGSADGPMVFTGFLPRWVMIKRTDSAESWQVYDTARDTFNTTAANLYPNLSNAEVTDNTGQNIDILSSGFKLRNTNARLNASGGTYVYACFASNPFKNALAR